MRRVGSVARSLAIIAILLLCTIQALAAETNTCGPSSRYIVAYYQTYKRQSMMNIDWSKISHLNVAHAIPSETGEFTFDGEWFLPQLVKEAHKENTKISISLGGWTGSNRMSTIMRDTHKRATLVRAISAFVETHELDGVDIDWEYVGRQASKCNKFAPAEDAANLLRFVRSLRASLHARFPDSSKIISLAVPVEPFHAQDGPMKDVAPFAEFVDFASILAFDINGPWSNSTGPSAPLEYQRHRGAPFSLTQAVDQWIDAKWPADKLVAGISFLGHSATTRSVLTAKPHSDMYTPIDRDVPQGDPEDALWYDVCENSNSMSGVWQYRHLRDQGILKTPNTTGDEWIRVWDDKSSTPWLYNPQMRRFVSYDDQESVDRKVEFVKAKGLKGVMAWGLHADYQGELVGALSRVGPLCRGPKSDSDEPSSSSSEVHSTSSSSSWSPTAPFASLPTPSHTSSSEHTSASPEASSEHTSASPEALSEHTSASPEAPSEHTSASAESSVEASPAKPEDHPSEPAPQSTSEPAAEHSAESTSASATGKSIVFDNLGAPYMVINGQTTTVASDLAEKLMQAGETHTTNSDMTATTTNELMPTAPLPIPVVDSLNPRPFHITSARKPLSAPTNLFNTPLLGKTLAHDVPTSGMLLDEQSSMDKASQPLGSPHGFAATFLLTLDTSSVSGGQTTTVIPFSQMMASAHASSEQSSASSILSAVSATDSASAATASNSMSLATASDSASASTSDPLATPSSQTLPI
ncbi:hypothetical protein GGH96_002808 [Coemansia sp. RSA 1972]|nr:hypothetical protein GGH96_002808 [Coemansia sp. RSA 1972]